MQLPNVPFEKKNKWLLCSLRVFKDVMRPFKFTGDAFDMPGKISVFLGYAPVPVAGGLAYLGQSYLPGVRNLYPWAFPVIMMVVGLAILMFITAVRYRARLDFGGPHNRDGLIRSAWDLHNAAWDLMQVDSNENRRQFEKARSGIFAELSVAGTRFDPWIRPYIVKATDNVQRC
jgi:hypothetical protein